MAPRTSNLLFQPRFAILCSTPVRMFATFPEQEKGEEERANLQKKAKQNAALPKAFDAKKSKYGLERQAENLKAKQVRQKPGSGAPMYLFDEQKV